MRKLLCFLLLGSVTFFGCHTKSFEDYVIIIRPIGPEDVPRTTFYISLKKTNFKKDNPFTEEILTDENSLRNVVSFIDEHRPLIRDTINRIGWGALNISVYNTDRLLINFDLTRGDYSKNYLRLLIEYLVNKNSDKNLINRLKEEGLSKIQ